MLTSLKSQVTIHGLDFTESGTFQQCVVVYDQVDLQNAAIAKCMFNIPM